MPSGVLSVDFTRMRMGRSESPGWTALHNDLRTDTLYAAVGTSLLPQRTGAAQSAVWRSRKIVLDGQPSFALLLLEGPFTSAVARLYGDGALFYTTPTITQSLPVPLPARRFREFELELELAGRLTRALLAGDSRELAMEWAVA